MTTRHHYTDDELNALIGVGFLALSLFTAVLLVIGLVGWLIIPFLKGTL